MSKNHFLDFKNLEKRTSQHDAVKSDGFEKMLLAYYFVFFHGVKYTQNKYKMIFTYILHHDKNMIHIIIHHIVVWI
jgi:hypothetical protein